METKQTPQLVLDYIATNFANKPKPQIKQTLKNTFMLSSGNICIYVILNPEQTQIIDIQVD